jgi:hypothetical protein
MNDFEKSHQLMKRALDEDWWSQRIDVIRKEKRKLLEEYAFFPRIQRIIETHEGAAAAAASPTPTPTPTAQHNPL